MSLDLSELNLLDDLDIDTESPETYADPTGPAPLPAGVKYRFRILDHELDKDRKTGEIRSPKTPTVVVSLEVVEPEQYAGRKVRFMRIRSSIWERDGKKVSQLGDLIRAFDTSTDYRGKEKFEALSRFQAAGLTFEARGDWRAFDSEHYKALLSGTPSPDKAQKRAAGDASTIRGMRKFPQRPDGSHSPVVVGPSGNELRAEFEITDFIPNK